MPNRSEVYAAIDSERDYQDTRWNVGTTTSEGKHSVSEFALYMDDYMTQMKNELSRHPSPKSEQMALETMRKIVGMGVACMEQNGAPHRG